MAFQWRVFRVGLDPAVGREQAGDGPVLVVSAEPLNMWYEVVTVVPITSRKGDRPARLGEVLLPAGIAGLARDSFALCYQPCALDKRRLAGLYGEIADTATRRQVAEAVSLCLDLPFPETPTPDDDIPQD